MKTPGNNFPSKFSSSRIPSYTKQWVGVAAILLLLAAFLGVRIIMTHEYNPFGAVPTSTPSATPLPASTQTPTLNPNPSVPLNSPNGLWLPEAAEIPAGLQLQTQNLGTTNLDVASQYSTATATALAQQEAATGRLSGQYRDYINASLCATTTGIYELTVQAILHSSSTGAAAALGLDVNYTSVPGIGNIAGLRLTNLQVSCTPPIDLRAVSLAFQRANVRGYVDISAIPGTIPDSDLESLAIRLATSMDGMIKADLR